jgi:hypothetical protein
LTQGLLHSHDEWTNNPYIGETSDVHALSVEQGSKEHQEQEESKKEVFELCECDGKHLQNETQVTFMPHVFYKSQELEAKGWLIEDQRNVACYFCQIKD